MLLKRNILKIIYRNALAITVSKILKLQTCFLEKVGEGRSCDSRNGAIRWQVFICLKVVQCILRYISVFERYKYFYFEKDFKKVGKSHGVQLSL